MSREKSGVFQNPWCSSEKMKDRATEAVPHLISCGDGGMSPPQQLTQCDAPINSCEVFDDI